jgi:hypothetical protein
LWHVRDAAARDPIGRQAEDLFAGELDAAGGAHQPGDGVAQRGLAHAVAADDGQHAVLDRECHALQRVRAPVVDVEALDPQDRAAHLGHAVVIALQPGH